jgi:hypothetical protein
MLDAGANSDVVAIAIQAIEEAVEEALEEAAEAARPKRRRRKAEVIRAVK